MAPPAPLLAVRGSEGLYMVNGPPSFTESVAFQRDSGKNCKAVAFSKDGSLFAWCNGEKVNVFNVTRAELLHSFDLPKTVCLEFSPKNNVLATWQAYATAKDGTAGVPNLQLHDLRTGKCLKSFVQKKMQNWCPCWAEDESICARNVNNEVHFFENNNFNTIANKLHLQKVSDFVLSPGAQPTKVAVYVPGSKGAPSFVRLYQYPNFGGPQSALANKSFFKADKVTMLWNKKATAVLVVASTEVDKSGASYYGEQTLHYLAASGESAVVQLPKNGPIYDVAWSPNSVEFCAVYGFMPAKATVFNLKCDPVFDFGTGPRNAAYYSPHGHILVLAGFGNLRGQMEVWDVKNYKLISKPVASDSTYFAWCPDGEHIVTATCAPRLRVGNGYKIWHYTGSVLHAHEVPADQEMWQHEDEPPQNMKPQLGGSDKPVSKVALKNQRKHEAKKAAKQEAKADAPQGPAQVRTPQNALQNTVPAMTTGDPEVDKKIKNLKKKLKAIEQLKEQAAAGKQLEKNQVEKIQKEAALLKELEDLELGV
ncbi:eukaryotic translation initiation factor 2A isoform X3 [Melozone crissalis]|uniref:eukaryotic translation initiation factor 2A isoform X3 n=1 Tax=Melozone crissalis TaxID=40204 RepID=UPI0023DA82AA|nr:eukaryotic translation initiation factor 2A isoform X3 [Melozone crissalis]